MAYLASYLRLSFVGLGAIVAVLPLSSGACSRTACFEYSQSEFAATHGCPSQANAIMSFTSPSCPQTVASVDGAGSFEALTGGDGICCYAVTEVDVDPDGAGGCFGTGVGGGGGGGFGGGGDTAFGGVGGSAGTGGGMFGGSTTGGGGSSQTSSSSGGGPGSCVTCSAELSTGGGTADQLCSDAVPFWDALTVCACSGACGAVCEMSFCVGMSDPTCSSCLLDPAPNGCSAQLMDCNDH